MPVLPPDDPDVPEMPMLPPEDPEVPPVGPPEARDEDGVVPAEE